MPVIGTGAPNRPGRGGAERRAAVPDLGQDRPRNAQEPQQLVVPVLAVDVEEHGARGVARVGGVHRAAGEPPQQERIDGAERQLAALGRRRAPATSSSSQASLVAEK